MKKLVSLISGSHGFLGTHLTKELIKRGHSVVPLSRQLLQEPTKLKQFIQKHNPDYIFHLAAYGNMANQTDEQEIFTANIIATWNLLQASRDIPYKGFIYTSTSQHVQDAATCYGVMKAACEDIIRYFKPRPIYVFQLYSVYGPGEADFRFIPTVIRSLIKGKTIKLSMGNHDWIYVDDVIRSILEILNRKPDIYQLGTKVMTPNGAILTKLMEISKKKAIIKLVQGRPWDSRKWVASDSAPYTRSIESGLKETYKYYKRKYDK